MSRTKRRIANLDPAESYKPQLVTTQYLDSNGVVRTTVHDGNFSPSPQEPTLVFVPAQFCGEIIGMKGDSHNPTQYTETNKNYLATAFISKIEQQIDAVDFVIDDNQYQASMKSRVVINDSTMGDYSQAFQAYLEQYKGTSQIVVAATELESALENGSHTIKVEYNGEESETMTFTVASADYMYFEAAEANSTVSMISTLTTAPNLEYSTDGETWQEWQHTTAEGTHTFDTITLTAVGDRVYLRGVNSAGFIDFENEEISLFSMTGKIAAGGNAQSLVDGDTPTLVAKTMPMFSDYIMTETPSDVLVSTPSLPATTLAGSCYYGMFEGCTGLTQAPSLPATTLAEGCYYGMFGGCTGLTQAPSLPATTLAGSCYVLMFGGCTGLTQAPSLPATTLAEGCYGLMFEGCTGLTQAPSLPATTLAGSCYYGMFKGCTGLTQAPSLPATTLAGSCYYGMFGGCTGLTQAPSLPATTLAGSCYSGMFDRCEFNMSDDGTTFNFQCGATLPQTVGEETFTTPAELANWMGNTNGFTTP